MSTGTLSRKAAHNEQQSSVLVHDESSEPHMVVSCPCCQTKFAVESGLIASYETPKFHCSRCDAVFEFSYSAKDFNPSRPNKLTHSTITTEASHTLGQTGPLPTNSNTPKSPSSTEEWRNEKQESTLRPSDFSLGEANYQSSISPSTIEHTAGRALLGFSDSSTSPSSITRGEFVARAAELGISDQTSQEASASTTSGDANQGTETPWDICSLFDSPFKTTNDEPKKTSQPVTRHAEAAVFENPSPFTIQRESEPVRQEANQAFISTKKAAMTQGITTKGKETFARFVDKNKDLFRMIRPIVKASCVVLLLGILTRIMPQTIDNVFGAVIPAALSGKRLTPPPTRLLVQDLTFKLIHTRSGETIPIVRGTVHNQETTSFDQVVVEAIGFNRQGIPVIRVQAPLRSALHREKIEDLTLETVKQFQTSINSVHTSIKPGESVPFTIALLSEPDDLIQNNLSAETLAFFSGRIFSVGK